MKLKNTNRPAMRVLTGRQVLGASAGQVLKIETSPDGEEILDETVPAGKSWEVTVRVDIVETDA
jgi:hypothetical protein